MFRIAVAASALLVFASCGPSQTATTPTAQPTWPPPIHTPSETGLAVEYSPTYSSTPIPFPTPIRNATAVCPEDRVNAGLRYQFDPDLFAEQEALLGYCGKPATPPAEHRPRSAWAVERGPDGIDRPYTDTILHNYHGVAENPRLTIWCDDGVLMAAISVGEDRVVPTPTNSPFVKIAFVFGDWDEPELSGPSFWEGWVGDNDSGAYTEIEQLPGMEVDFVWALRRYDRASFNIASASGVNTIHFDLAGADRDVGPVLRECGY